MAGGGARNVDARIVWVLLASGVAGFGGLRAPRCSPHPPVVQIVVCSRAQMGWWCRRSWRRSLPVKGVLRWAAPREGVDPFPCRRHGGPPAFFFGGGGGGGGGRRRRGGIGRSERRRRAWRLPLWPRLWSGGRWSGVSLWRSGGGASRAPFRQCSHRAEAGSAHPARRRWRGSRWDRVCHGPAAPVGGCCGRLCHGAPVWDGERLDRCRPAPRLHARPCIKV